MRCGGSAWIALRSRTVFFSTPSPVVTLRLPISGWACRVVSGDIPCAFPLSFCALAASARNCLFKAHVVDPTARLSALFRGLFRFLRVSRRQPWLRAVHHTRSRLVGHRSGPADQSVFPRFRGRADSGWRVARSLRRAARNGRDVVVRSAGHLGVWRRAEPRCDDGRAPADRGRRVGVPGRCIQGVGAAFRERAPAVDERARDGDRRVRRRDGRLAAHVGAGFRQLARGLRRAGSADRAGSARAVDSRARTQSAKLATGTSLGAQFKRGTVAHSQERGVLENRVVLSRDARCFLRDAVAVGRRVVARRAGFRAARGCRAGVHSRLRNDGRLRRFRAAAARDVWSGAASRCMRFAASAWRCSF